MMEGLFPPLFLSPTNPSSARVVHIPDRIWYSCCQGHRYPDLQAVTALKLDYEILETELRFGFTLFPNSLTA